MVVERVPDLIAPLLINNFFVLGASWEGYMDPNPSMDYFRIISVAAYPNPASVWLPPPYSGHQVEYTRNADLLSRFHQLPVFTVILLHPEKKKKINEKKKQQDLTT